MREKDYIHIFFLEKGKGKYLKNRAQYILSLFIFLVNTQHYVVANPLAGKVVGKLRKGKNNFMKRFILYYIIEYSNVMVTLQPLLGNRQWITTTYQPFEPCSYDLQSDLNIVAAVESNIDDWLVLSWLIL